MKKKIKVKKDSAILIIGILLLASGVLSFAGIPAIPFIAMPILFFAFIYALFEYRKRLNPNLRPKKVLIIEDDEDSKNLLEFAIKSSGHQIIRWVSGTGEDVPETILKEKPDVIILDWKLENGALGSEVISDANRMIDKYEEFRETYQNFKPKIITYSASREPSLMKEPEHFQVVEHWSKGMGYEDLRSHVAKVLESA